MRGRLAWFIIAHPGVSFLIGVVFGRYVCAPRSAPPSPERASK